ncbi:hypothetical protein [Streptomyces glaucus]|uniref:hypothetical protein n=1 Tax=Streptomyces glaucus TaxID=284029 RepID=UPI0031D01555
MTHAKVLMLNESILSTPLAEAGLRLLRMVDTSEPLIPPTLATFASSCGTEDGAWGETVDLDHPRLREEANSLWRRMALHGGLFSEEDSRFLIAVNLSAGESPRWWWAQVQLLDEWDMVDAGAASGVLGHGPFRPSFVMLSLDGGVILRCDLGQASMDFSMVREAHHAPTLLRHGEWMAGSPRVDDVTRAATRRWLSRRHTSNQDSAR